MDYVMTDSNGNEMGYLDKTVSIDIDVGNTNDFELILNKYQANRISKGCYFFCPETEFGGILEEINSSTSEVNVIYRGYTWREFLNQLIIQPPVGQNYLTVSGDANQIIEQLLKTGTGTMFSVPDELADINIKKYQFRYNTALSGITKMLSDYGARLDIRAVQVDGKFKIIVQAVKIKNYSEELEYNGDDRINVSVNDYSRGINHLICLGQGELAARTVIHLYVQLDGSISQKQYYTDIHERMAVYDNASTSDVDELIKGGIDRLKSLMNYKSANMTVKDIGLEIGDIISARDRDAGIILSRPIISKILRYSDGTSTIEYKVKGEQ